MDRNLQILLLGRKCVKCGETANLHIDHIKARALGGSDEMMNKQLLCPNCHAAKTKEDWKKIAVQRSLGFVPKSGALTTLVWFLKQLSRL